ncbi:hypothetical protein [Mesoterricola silvestris]|uniref:Uncharacterized protein n=1 Tax=Mesoterricola silvestris TaxID=2927979 RepID=A0AA48KAI4_9BACT|nr:hypothetical protein [Mesoterricola silvestris]BDU73342.1 hypothetical protein METEAL_25160 [Mesoterricola silvestris]
MRPILPVGLGVILLLAGGLYLGMRHQPSGSLLDEPANPFAVEPAQPGWRVKFVDSQIPLRALKWLPPRQAGILLAQVQTQSDRQQVAVFRDGASAGSFPVTRPQGVSEGFWRFAQLQDGWLAPDGAVVLLYRAGDAASSEPALAMALEAGAPEARWVHRGAYERMAVSGGPEPAVFLFGPKGPVQRLPLAGTARRPVAKDIELPPEVPELEDLLPTGPWTFLASSRNGLSAYLGTKGWTHFPAPEDRGVPCAGWRSALAHGGKRYWWQPAPGKIVQVAQDGTLVADRDVTGFAPEDALARDAKLLRLLGADASGRLWFGLATPAPQEAGLEDWPAYAAQGLGRVYRWNPDKETLERLLWSQAWASLNPPPEVALGAPVLHPGAGTMLLAGSRAGWWLPLESLPFRNCAS